ncbi:MAG: hypothetical protein ABI995_04575 [Acidobacteriota bacterium]
MELFRTAVEALANQDVDGFMGHFDAAIPGRETLRGNIATMLAMEGATSTIDYVDDMGDDVKRRVRIDWLLRVGFAAPKRGIVTITVEKRRRSWKITALEPLDFFKAPSP